MRCSIPFSPSICLYVHTVTGLATGIVYFKCCHELDRLFMTLSVLRITPRLVSSLISTRIDTGPESRGWGEEASNSIEDDVYSKDVEQMSTGNDCGRPVKVTFRPDAHSPGPCTALVRFVAGEKDCISLDSPVSLHSSFPAPGHGTS